jgi:glycosyltransferase involved in cell wall biosynthesis
MRVAYVCTDPRVPVFGSKGASVHVQGVLGALRRRGADVQLFTTRPGGAGPAGLAVRDLGRPAALETAARERALLAGNATLRRALEVAGPFDLVYERHALFAWAGMEYAAATGAAGVLEVNAPLVEEQAAYRSLVDRFAAEDARRRALAAADTVVAVSAALARPLERIPEARGKVHVVFNGVDLGRFPARERGAADRPFTVAFVGSLKPWHGLHTLIDAFTALRAEVPGARLIVIGDGPGRADLEEHAQRAGVADAVTCTGAVRPAAVGGLLAAADVAVAPYPAIVEDHFSPLKVFEGMAAGLPVVAACVGQVEDIIDHDRTGLLCPPGDARSMARALIGLAADPERRRRIGEAARAQVLGAHTWDHVLTSVLEAASFGGLELAA